MSESVFASSHIVSNNTLTVEQYRARKVALITGK